MEKFLTMADMCKRFDCCKDTVRKMVREHRLPAPTKRGRKHVWFESSVERTIERERMAGEKNVRAAAF